MAPQSGPGPRGGIMLGPGQGPVGRTAGGSQLRSCGRAVAPAPAHASLRLWPAWAWHPKHLNILGP